MQTLAEQFGGQVISSEFKEFGYSELKVKTDSILFSNLNNTLNVWMSHGDQVQDLPDNFDLLASSTSAPIAAMQHLTEPIYALQFHPEVTHTDDGKTILNLVVPGENGMEDVFLFDGQQQLVKGEFFTLNNSIISSVLTELFID